MSLCLASNFPINIIWGPDAIQIYNSGYRIVCGQAHPRAVGESFERAQRGETSFLENQRIFINRNGYLEETFFTFSLSPILDENGEVAGLFHPVTETTGTMLTQRRTRALKDVTDNASKVESVAEATKIIVQSLVAYSLDIPFIAFFSVDSTNQSVKLVAHAGVSDTQKLQNLDLNFFKFASNGKSGLSINQIDNVENYFGKIPSGEYPELVERAFIIEIKTRGSENSNAFVVVGLSRRLPLDENYRNAW